MVHVIWAPIISLVLGKVFDSLDLGLKLNLTKEQFIEQSKQALFQSAGEIEKAWADATKVAIAEAQATIRASFSAPDWLTRNTWAFVAWSQTLVLLWYQMGIPFYVWYFGGTFPRTGDDLLQWAYALVGGAIGVRALQGGGDSLKSLIALARK